MFRTVGSFSIKCSKTAVLLFDFCMVLCCKTTEPFLISFGFVTHFFFVISVLTDILITSLGKKGHVAFLVVYLYVYTLSALPLGGEDCDLRLWRPLEIRYLFLRVGAYSIDLIDHSKVEVHSS